MHEIILKSLLIIIEVAWHGIFFEVEGIEPGTYQSRANSANHYTITTTTTINIRDTIDPHCTQNEDRDVMLDVIKFCTHLL